MEWATFFFYQIIMLPYNIDVQHYFFFQYTHRKRNMFSVLTR